MTGSAPPHLHPGTDHDPEQESSNKTSKSLPAHRVGQAGVFLVSLGDLAEAKGFESPTGGGTGLTPEKASGQYRKTKLTETHRKTQRERDTHTQ